MTNSLRPHSYLRTPLPQAEQPAEQPTDGVPSPRSSRTPRPAPDTAASDARPAIQRDAFFDNAKYLAIVLVAMGHAWEPLTDHSRAAEALYMVVYTFHMPAFILISGYFSRSFDMRPDRLQRLVTGIAVPYVDLRGRVLALQALGRRRPRPRRSACSTPGTSPGSWSRCSSGG